MPYLHLAIAIVAEVIATSFLKQAEGFTRLVPSLVTLAGYAVAFYFLSLALRSVPTGVAYAIWSGAGIVLIATAAWLFHGQKLDAPALIGMGLIDKPLALVNNLTGVTIGIGFGAVSGSTCSLQIQTPVATIGQELFAPNGASAGGYCVQIFDCPTGTANCSSTLVEPVNYSMTVKHY